MSLILLTDKESSSYMYCLKQMCIRDRYNHGIATGEIPIEVPPFFEEDVYTFLQGHRAWESNATWSGEWCMKYAKGQYFSGFGCGFCCVANVYSTLSPYTCSPLDVYDYAYKETGYTPSKTNSALDWGNMKVILKDLGMSCDVYYKDNSYEAFRDQIRSAKMAITLVSLSLIHISHPRCESDWLQGAMDTYVFHDAMYSFE